MCKAWICVNFNCGGFFDCVQATTPSVQYAQYTVELAPQLKIHISRPYTLPSLHDYGAIFHRSSNLTAHLITRDYCSYKQEWVKLVRLGKVRLGYVGKFSLVRLLVLGQFGQVRGAFQKKKSHKLWKKSIRGGEVKSKIKKVYISNVDYFDFYDIWD